MKLDNSNYFILFHYLYHFS